MTIFHKDGDYAAFERVLEEGLQKYAVETNISLSCAGTWSVTRWLLDWWKRQRIGVTAVVQLVRWQERCPTGVLAGATFAQVDRSGESARQ
jgi:hypothetical protein